MSITMYRPCWLHNVQALLSFIIYRPWWALQRTGLVEFTMYRPCRIRESLWSCLVFIMVTPCTLNKVQVSPGKVNPTHPSRKSKNSESKCIPHCKCAAGAVVREFFQYIGYTRSGWQTRHSPWCFEVVVCWWKVYFWSCPEENWNFRRAPKGTSDFVVCWKQLYSTSDADDKLSFCHTLTFLSMRSELSKMTDTLPGSDTTCLGDPTCWVNPVSACFGFIVCMWACLHMCFFRVLWCVFVWVCMCTCECLYYVFLFFWCVFVRGCFCERVHVCFGSRLSLCEVIWWRMSCLCISCVCV